MWTSAHAHQMTGSMALGNSYPTRCLSCEVPIKNADAVENPDRTGSDRNVAMAPTPKIRIIICQKPTQRVKARVTCTLSGDGDGDGPCVAKETISENLFVS